MASGPSIGRIGRGLFRKGGRRGPSVSSTFHLLPNWKSTTSHAIKPDMTDYSSKVYDAMVRGMARASRRRPGGGYEPNGDDFDVGIGDPGFTRTHWHLIEFGGGNHHAQAVVRRELKRMGKFKESGP
jgi:hypothetical protein